MGSPHSDDLIHLLPARALAFVARLAGVGVVAYLGALCWGTWGHSLGPKAGITLVLLGAAAISGLFAVPEWWSTRECSQKAAGRGAEACAGDTAHEVEDIERISP